MDEPDHASGQHHFFIDRPLARRIFSRVVQRRTGGQQYTGGSTTNANAQTAAVNPMWGLMNTYDMLKNTFGSYSLDGNNTATYIAAHVARKSSTAASSPALAAGTATPRRPAPRLPTTRWW